MSKSLEHPLLFGLNVIRPKDKISTFYNCQDSKVWLHNSLVTCFMTYRHFNFDNYTYMQNKQKHFTLWQIRSLSFYLTIIRSYNKETRRCFGPKFFMKSKVDFLIDNFFIIDKHKQICCANIKTTKEILVFWQKHFFFQQKRWLAAKCWSKIFSNSKAESQWLHL